MSRDATILSALRDAPRSGALEFHLEEGRYRMGHEELLARAGGVARGLARLGVEPGDRVGLLGRNRPEWVAAAFGIWGAGATLVPLQLPVRIRDASAFAAQTASLVRAGACRHVLCEPAFTGAIADGLALDWGAFGEDDMDSSRMPDPHDVAVVQFTSGSTAAPKGVPLEHRAIVAILRIYFDEFGMDPGVDRYAGWLPFFHDNGLFGYAVRPYLHGCDGHILPTERFAREPALWFRVATQAEATFTSGPSSAWAVAARAASKDPSGMDLRSLRYAVSSAETIDPDVIDRLVEVGPTIGLSPSVLSGAYGMAETTLGVTLSPQGGGLRIDRLDLARLAEGVAEPAGAGPSKRIASCGVVLPEIDVRIAGEQGPLPDRRVGEIQCRTPAATRGYVGGDSDELFVDGWLRTGDLGYFDDGHLFFVGRSKDIVIVYGRNYSAEDIEWAASRVPGVRPGRCVAFATRDAREGEAVVALEVADDVDPADVPARVRARVLDSIGLAPADVLVVPKGTILKTTSGKLRRNVMREAYERDGFSTVVASLRRG